jgi:hypothetical protein
MWRKAKRPDQDPRALHVSPRRNFEPRPAFAAAGLCRFGSIATDTVAVEAAGRAAAQLLTNEDGKIPSRKVRPIRADNFAVFIDAASTPSNLKIELGGPSNTVSQTDRAMKSVSFPIRH